MREGFWEGFPPLAEDALGIAPISASGDSRLTIQPKQATSGRGAGNRPPLYERSEVQLWQMTKPWEELLSAAPNRVEALGIEPRSENASPARLRTYPAV